LAGHVAHPAAGQGGSTSLRGAIAGASLAQASTAGPPPPWLAIRWAASAPSSSLLSFVAQGGQLGALRPGSLAAPGSLRRQAPPRSGRALRPPRPGVGCHAAAGATLPPITLISTASLKALHACSRTTRAVRAAASAALFSGSPATAVRPPAQRCSPGVNLREPALHVVEQVGLFDWRRAARLGPGAGGCRWCHQRAPRRASMNSPTVPGAGNPAGPEPPGRGRRQHHGMPRLILPAWRRSACGRCGRRGVGSDLPVAFTTTRAAQPLPGAIRLRCRFTAPFSWPWPSRQQLPPRPVRGCTSGAGPERRCWAISRLSGRRRSGHRVGDAPVARAPAASGIWRSHLLRRRGERAALMRSAGRASMVVDRQAARVRRGPACGCGQQQLQGLGQNGTGLLQPVGRARPELAHSCSWRNSKF